MNTEITDNSVKEPTGWIFYDAECAFCVHGVMRWSNLFARRGFCWLPMQTPGTAERLGVDEQSLGEEMKVLLANGRVAGGIDAWASLLRSVWWLWPIGVLLESPGIHWLGAKSYHWLARNRYCIGGRCKLSEHRKVQKHAAFFEMP